MSRINTYLKQNRSDFIKLMFFLLILFSALGAALPGFTLFGFQFYAFRILLLLVFLYSLNLLMVKRIGFAVKPIEKMFFFFLTGFIVLGLTSAYRVFDLNGFIKELAYWFIALIIIFSISYLKRQIDLLELRELVYNSLLFIFVMVVGFTVFEYYTAIHLNVKVTFTEKLFENDPSRIIRDPYFSFANPNKLCLFLVTISSVILLYFKDKKMEISLFLYFSTFFVSLICQSRLSILSLLILLPVLIINILPWIRANKKLIVVGVFFIGFAILSTGLITLKSQKNNTQVEIVENSEVLVEDTITAPNSNTIRKNLILNSIAAVEESNYLGLGSGQFNSYLASGKAKYEVHGVNNAHGFLIMIFANYGVGGIILLFGLVLYWLNILYKKIDNKLEQVSHLLFIVSLIVSSFGPSSFIQQPYLWTILACYVVLFNTTSALGDES